MDEEKGSYKGQIKRVDTAVLDLYTKGYIVDVVLQRKFHLIAILVFWKMSSKGLELVCVCGDPVAFSLVMVVF